MRRRASGGQSITEYALLLITVLVAVGGMQLYAKRGIQAAVKAGADTLSPENSSASTDDPTGELAQAAGERYETGDKQFKLSPVGQVVRTNTAVSTVQPVASNVTVRREQLGGRVSRTFTQHATSVGAIGGLTGVVAVSESITEDLPEP